MIDRPKRGILTLRKMIGRPKRGIVTLRKMRETIQSLIDSGKAVIAQSTRYHKKNAYSRFARIAFCVLRMGPALKGRPIAAAPPIYILKKT